MNKYEHTILFYLFFLATVWHVGSVPSNCTPVLEGGVSTHWTLGKSWYYLILSILYTLFHTLMFSFSIMSMKTSLFFCQVAWYSIVWMYSCFIWPALLRKMPVFLVFYCCKLMPWGDNYIHTTFWVYADILAEQIPRSVIAGWKTKYICNFASHWQYMKMPVPTVASSTDYVVKSQILPNW